MVAMGCDGVNVHERARLAGAPLAALSPVGSVGRTPVTDLVGTDEAIVIHRYRVVSFDLPD